MSKQVETFENVLSSNSFKDINTQKTQGNVQVHSQITA